ncbi:hypothetical protein M422DRAFT_57255 [Sphaerobolus stellatus SS14]|nr:hypothetical protein M422DRAFT_57255 [Sphaerobolus stellatus SS14]
MTDIVSSPKIEVTEDEVPGGEPAMKARVEQMEREAAALRDMQAGGYTHVASSTSTPQGTLGHGIAGSEHEGMETEEEKEAADARSIYVGNVDYAATPEEIQTHFASCGTINRVTILCDKFTGHPKGYAYVEFAEPGHVQHALVLNDSMFRGRLIKVSASTAYPFASNVILPRPPIPNPTPGLLKGRGLMAELYKAHPSRQIRKLLATLFSRRHPERILPGSVLTITSTQAPTSFTGIVLAIRRRGTGTSLVLRNIIQRTGVEMQFFVASPHLKNITIVKRAGKDGKARRDGLGRAKLYYLRDSPDKMSRISSKMKA